MTKILLVEDDQKYLEFMKNILLEEGYEVDAVSDVASALEFASKRQYNLIVSDYQMEIMDGLRLVKTIKNMQSMIRSIILTGYPDEESELLAIGGVANQYIVKEKPVNVILKYIEKVLNDRVVEEKEDLLVSISEGIVLDKKHHTVVKDEEEVILTPKEFSILELFLREKGEILSRQRIIQEVWGLNSTDVDERMVDIHVKNIRDKLKTFSLVSIRGFGYKWNE